MKKHCVKKVSLAIWEIFLHENNRNHDSHRFSCKFAFILFLSFLTNQKQESGMPNSIDFYKGIFLHVIPVRMIVPYFNISVEISTHGKLNSLPINCIYDDGEDNDDEFFCGMVDPWKAFSLYFQPGPLSEILTIANLPPVRFLLSRNAKKTYTY